MMDRRSLLAAIGAMALMPAEAKQTDTSPQSAGWQNWSKSLPPQKAQIVMPDNAAALADIIEAAHGQNKSVSICGELAGDPRAAPLLVAMGFDQLSMNAGSLSVIKRVLSAFSRAELEVLLSALRPLRSSQEVVATLDRALSERGLDIFLRRGGAV